MKLCLSTNFLRSISSSAQFHVSPHSESVYSNHFSDLPVNNICLLGKKHTFHGDIYIVVQLSVTKCQDPPSQALLTGQSPKSSYLYQQGIVLFNSRNNRICFYCKCKIEVSIQCLSRSYITLQGCLCQ